MTGRITQSFITAIFFGFFSLGLFCSPAFVAADEFDFYFKIENFTWKEFDDSGSQLLKESGPVYGLGASARLDVSSSLTTKMKAELFRGSIDYDGQTWAGTPVNSETDYSGFKAEGDIGRIIMISERSSLEPFAGLGYRWWLRDVRSTKNAIGYEEKWWSFYGRLGVRGSHTFSDQQKVFAEAGLKLPITTENEADLRSLPGIYSGLPKVTVEPGNKPSIFAEAGITLNRFKTSLFYEGMRFSKSGDVYVCGDFVCGLINQPESQADILGINVGLSF